MKVLYTGTYVFDQYVLINWHYQSIFTLRDLSLQSDFVFDIDIFPIKLKGNSLKPTYSTFLTASLTLFSNCLYFMIGLLTSNESVNVGFIVWSLEIPRGTDLDPISWFNPDILLYLSELSKTLDFHRLLLCHVCTYCIVVWFKQYFISHK